MTPATSRVKGLCGTLIGSRQRYIAPSRSLLMQRWAVQSRRLVKSITQVAILCWNHSSPDDKDCDSTTPQVHSRIAACRCRPPGPADVDNVTLIFAIVDQRSKRDTGKEMRLTPHQTDPFSGCSPRFGELYTTPWAALLDTAAQARCIRIRRASFSSKARRYLLSQV